MKKLVIAGGTGFVGGNLLKYFLSFYDQIVVLSRSAGGSSGKIKYVNWDARTLGEWAKELENATALINLAGKSVNCRYTKKNRALILNSRITSTYILGEAIKKSAHPPAIWINASSAVIYKDLGETPSTEVSELSNPGFMADVSRAWEKTFMETQTPYTKKAILRITMVMGKDGGVFPVLSKLVKWCLGGRQGSGQQIVSWIHIDDLCRLIDHIIEQKAEGAYNAGSPYPISNKTFMKSLRTIYGIPFGIPSSRWMLEIGAFFMRTETELVLANRNVIPQRAINERFKFHFPDIDSCVSNLVRKKSPLNIGTSGKAR